MLHEFVYLFLTDLARTSAHDYESYTKEEPGYGSCMLRAYISAFNIKTNGLLSEELIHAIHKEAMSFSPNSTPGQYKNDHNHMTIFPYEMDNNFNKGYGATPEGINEFIEYWIKNTVNPIHSFCHVNQKKSPADEFLFIPKPNGMMLHSTDSDGKRNKPLLVNLDGSEQLINKLMSSSLYHCEINHFIEEPKEKIQKLTSQRMQIIIKEFNSEIQKAQTSDEKILIIAKHLQRIDQVHPYTDGNIRTCYILMNKLLKDHGLSLTLLMNPNRLDACSLVQIVDMIKQGQIHYQQVIHHIEGNLQLSAEKEFHEDNQLFTCLPQKLDDISKLLVDDFIACVIEGKLIQLNVLKNNPYSFLAAPKKDPTEKLLEELSLLIDFKDEKHNPIITALGNKQNNLALRQICAYYNRDIIMKIIGYHYLLSLNPLEKSSNGNTAIDWLKNNKHLNPNEKEVIKDILLSFEDNIVLGLDNNK